MQTCSSNIEDGDDSFDEFGSFNSCNVVPVVEHFNGWSSSSKSSSFPSFFDQNGFEIDSFDKEDKWSISLHVNKDIKDSMTSDLKFSDCVEEKPTNMLANSEEIHIDNQICFSNENNSKENFSFSRQNCFSFDSNIIQETKFPHEILSDEEINLKVANTESADEILFDKEVSCKAEKSVSAKEVWFDKEIGCKVEGSESAKKVCFNKNVEENISANKFCFDKNVEENVSVKEVWFDKNVQENVSAKEVWFDKNVEESEAANEVLFDKNVEGNESAEEVAFDKNVERNESDEEVWFDKNVEESEAAKEVWFDKNVEESKAAKEVWFDKNVEESEAAKEVWFDKEISFKAADKGILFEDEISHDVGQPVSATDNMFREEISCNDEDDGWTADWQMGTFDKEDDFADFTEFPDFHSVEPESTNIVVPLVDQSSAMPNIANEFHYLREVDDKVEHLCQQAFDTNSEANCIDDAMFSLLAQALNMVSNHSTLKYEDDVSVTVATDTQKIRKSNVWNKITDLENSPAVRFAWDNSLFHENMLLAMNIDVRNVLIGKRKLPVYAAQLGMLEPIKGSVIASSASLNDNIVTQQQQAYHTNSVGFDAVDDENGEPGGTGTENYTSPLDFDLSMLVNTFEKSSGSASSPIIDVNTAPINVAPSISAATLPRSVTVPNSFSSCHDFDRDGVEFERLSIEARELLARLPKLAYMRAKVLMFPVRSVSSTTIHSATSD